jgi:ankyrin repeat protein
MFWYETQESIDHCLEAAQVIMDKYPNYRIFSLGQSPAWIVESIHLISAAKNLNRQIGFVPFSGNFYADEPYNDNGNNITANRFKLNARPQDEANYLTLLSSLQVDVDSIIHNAKNGQKTVILEYVSCGRGLSSFLSVLYFAAQKQNCWDELKNSLTICILKEDENSTNSVLFFGDDHKVNFEYESIVVDKKTMTALSGDSATGIFSDRLVPRYTYQDWKSPPALPEMHRENLDQVRTSLRENIQVKYNLANALAPFPQLQPDRINVQNDDGETPLYIACKRFQFERVKFLLQHEHIDINKPTHRGMTPLHKACRNGNDKAVSLLINDLRIKDVNQLDGADNFPLLYACINGHTNIVNMLLQDDRFDINHADSAGITVLYATCERNQVDMITILLKDQCIDVNQADNEGLIPLLIACKKNHSQTVEILLQDKRTEIKDIKALIDFSENNKAKDVVKVLLQYQQSTLSHVSSNDNKPQPAEKFAPHPTEATPRNGHSKNLSSCCKVS